MPVYVYAYKLLSKDIADYDLNDCRPVGLADDSSVIFVVVVVVSAGAAGR